MKESRQLAISIGPDDRLRLDDVMAIVQERLGRRRAHPSQVMRRALEVFHEYLMRVEDVEKEGQNLDRHKAEWGGRR